MLVLGFNLLNAFEIEVAALGNGLGGIGRHNSGFSQRQAGRRFHLQPAAKLVFIAPDAAHFRPRITGNQVRSLLFPPCGTGDDTC